MPEGNPMIEDGISLYSILLMALIVALGYGLSFTGLVNDLAIIQQLVNLR